MINAGNYRNFGGFFQHLPSEAEAENYKLDSDQKIAFATANIEMHCVTYQDYPILLIKTKRDIKQGEILGWPYDDMGNYWVRLKSVPHLFTLSGAMLQPQDYHAENLHIFLKNEDMAEYTSIHCSLETLKIIQEKKEGLIRPQYMENGIATGLVLRTTVEDIKREYNKNPQKPYLMLDNVAIEKRTRGSSYLFKSPSKLKSPEEIMRKELNRIGELLRLPEWEYRRNGDEINFSLDVPEEDLKTLETLRDHLMDHLKQNNKKYIEILKIPAINHFGLFLMNLTVADLKAISACPLPTSAPSLKWCSFI